ncbi:DUF5983 family protein [Phytobacter diazotrophicus]|uniref:DUF5983 family protein n=1 Tax=Phytobacter diazotrophicus TaxID=395631 RepID=UPI001C99243A|nr:DUF5983 family protein [Phytobacter diazotrophicus]MBY6260093.1 DUF5983 family protein [Phytobacter diazotrophicus]
MLRKHYLQNAPHGVTGIQLNNGDEAIYIDGECIACCDIGERDDAVIATGQRIAEKMGVPFHMLTLTAPDDEEWSWNDITDSLGWGKSIIMPRMMLRPVMECSIAHLTKEDNFLLQDMSLEKHEGSWIMDTGCGYLIRLEAVTNPLHRLKKLGLSRAARELIFCVIRRADISMIHFSNVGDEVDNAPIFDW